MCIPHVHVTKAPCGESTQGDGGERAYNDGQMGAAPEEG